MLASCVTCDDDEMTSRHLNRRKLLAIQRASQQHAERERLRYTTCTTGEEQPQRQVSTNRASSRRSKRSAALDAQANDEHDDVSVLYVDYGNSAVVSKSQVREVAEPFVTWPVHVLRCSLADVQPMGAQRDDVSVRQWDEESRARFRELCDDVTSDRDSK